MRAIIERLKASAQINDNRLVESLEEALSDGRFQVLLTQGAVEEGRADVCARLLILSMG